MTQKNGLKKTEQEKKWDLCNAIINMARQAKGLPLRKKDNPHLSGEHKK